MALKDNPLSLFVNLSRKESRASLEDEYKFTKIIKGSGLLIDGFLEDLREKFAQNGILCYNTGDSERGHDRVGSGTMGSIGQIGGGEVPRSSLILSSWNPFSIRYVEKKYSFLGSFKGRIKVIELQSYRIKAHELRDYKLLGNIDFVPYREITLSVFLLSLFFSFYFGVGFWAGLLVCVCAPMIFYVIARKVGDRDIIIAERKVDAAVVGLEKYIKDFAS